MIRINLLPIRQIKKRLRLRNEFLAFITAVVVLLVVIAMTGFGQTQRITELKKNIVTLTQERDSYQAVLKKIETIKKQKADLEAKLAVIDKLKLNSQVTVRIVDEIATLTPINKMWLQSLQLSASMVKLSGIALDNSIIAQYMKELSGSFFFADPDLANSSEIKVADKKLKAFALTISVKGLAVEPPPPVAGAPAAKPPGK